jgi:Domain of unknown function (DU1801)
MAEADDEAILAFLADYPAEAQAICQHLRGVVRLGMPGAQEMLYASQNHLGYGPSARASDRLCYICPLRDYVRLGFRYGATLPDPDGLLQGEGKRLRHVKVRTLAEARNPGLLALVTAANLASSLPLEEDAAQHRRRARTDHTKQ